MSRHASIKKHTTDAIVTPEVIFGQLLRERREALGLRQIDLEDDESMDRSYISKLELGKRQICLRGFIHLARKLQMTPEELMGAVMNRLGVQEPD